MALWSGKLTGWCAAFALTGVWGARVSTVGPDSINVLIGGDVQGALSPCGCTFPMTGGIRRLATAVKLYRGPGGVFLENGGLIEESPSNLVGRKQNVFSAAALADALRAMNVDAVNIGHRSELSAGQGTLADIEQLTDSKAISTSLQPSPSNRLLPWIVRGPFLVGGITPAAETLAQVTGETALSSHDAANRLVAEASARGLTPILLFRGGQVEAQALAQSEPGLRLIVYKTAGTAPPEPITVGNTLLVTPGDQSKNLVRLEFGGTTFSHYSTVTLTPNYADEPKVSKIYRDYLTQVDRANLISELPRTKTAAFAGSKSCMSCHAAAYKVWHASAHAHALADLENQHHARDPDCLGCHVTGLASTAGFRTRILSPQLANVTCEACHGPARAHVLAPRTTPTAEGCRANMYQLS